MMLKNYCDIEKEKVVPSAQNKATAYTGVY